MNILDRLFVELYAKHQDPWLEARKKSAALREAAREIGVPEPALIATEHGIICDLNRYRVGYSLAKLMQRGVKGFILRMGGPSQWVEGNFAYKEDETWRGYMDQAKALGIQSQVGGYIIHNPFEDWKLTGVISNVHMNLINQWTSGGYMPGYLILDHEINYCWRGSIKIIVTPYNLVQSLASVTAQMWSIFKKVPMVYTARWFVDANGPAEHMTYFDNINGPATGKQRAMWWAWYPVGLTKTYQGADEILSEITAPTSTQIAKYLQCGSYSLADGVQFTDRLKMVDTRLDGSADTLGCDASYTFGTWAQYCEMVNIPATVTPADTTPPTAPTNFSYTLSGYTPFMTWSSATDNVGVTGYTITRDGVKLADVTECAYSDTGTNPGAVYVYTLTARDAAGNVSPAASLSVTIPTEPPPPPATDLEARVKALEDWARGINYKG